MYFFLWSWTSLVRLIPTHFFLCYHKWHYLKNILFSKSCCWYIEIWLILYVNFYIEILLNSLINSNNFFVYSFGFSIHIIVSFINGCTIYKTVLFLPFKTSYLLFLILPYCTIQCWVEMVIAGILVLVYWSFFPITVKKVSFFQFYWEIINIKKLLLPYH